ncbi:MAG: hypothetical protein IPJ03_14410 [Ignavibacteriales bacterium]|nr:hypothetical protein [Ignavibacteriales bacterium]
MNRKISLSKGKRLAGWDETFQGEAATRSHGSIVRGMDGAITGEFRS